MAPSSAQKSLGCVALIPAALVGLAGFTDGIGPTGWRGLSELLNWFYLCLIGSWLLALLLARGSQGGVRDYALALTAAALVGLLSYQAICWLGLNAPMSSKIRFTSSMQIVGSLGTGLCVLWIGLVALAGNRRS